MALHVINLTYEQVPAAMTAGSTSSTQKAPVYYEATAMRTDQRVRKEQDTMEWKSNDDYITLELRPKCMFSPYLFSTDPVFCEQHNINKGEPVKILEIGPFRYWCGFRDKGGKEEPIGYPIHRDIGVEDPGHP